MKTQTIQQIDLTNLHKQLENRLTELNDLQREESTKVELYRKELEKASWLKMTSEEKEEKIKIASIKLEQIISAKMEVYKMIRMIESNSVK